MTATAGRLPSAILALAVGLLPAPYRPRYRVELAAELADVPAKERLPYALRVLVRGPALRSALSRYRPTIGETAMTASSSNPWSNSLHERQTKGDFGHTVLGSFDRVTSTRRWRSLGLTLAAIVLGVILGLWGPLPGLGLVLVMSGTMGLGAVAIVFFNDYTS